MTVSNKLTRKFFRRRSDAWTTPDSSEHSTAPELDTNKRRTEITVETQRVTRITRGNVSAAAWCAECELTVWMLRPEEAAVLCGISPRLVYRLVEARRLHSIESLDALLICLKSLETSLADDESRRIL